MFRDVRPTIVIDLGSCTTKVGLSTEEKPQRLFPTLCATNGGEQICGDEAVACSLAEDYRYPMERGIIRRWDDLEVILDYAVNSLPDVKPNEHAILISEPPLVSKITKEKTAEILFEKQGVPLLHIANHDILSLYSSNRSTGLVLSSGDGVTSITPIQDGFMIASQVKKLNIVGLDLTLRVKDELNKQGCYFREAVDYAKLREIKESLCHVSVDLGSETPSEKSFYLSDGQSVTLGEGAYLIPELMFTPTDLESISYHSAVYETIMKCDVSMRKDMYNNIILCGGNTLFTGFADRMDKELAKLVPKSLDVKTILHPDGLNAVWLGGAILSSLSTFQNSCISRQDFMESGSRVVHQKTNHSV